MGSKRKSILNDPLKSSKKPKLDNDSKSYLRRAGVVNRMVLKNFMCHSLLEVDFSTNNKSFVIGNNGSGKSAILTALIIGLGGKATLTNRGNNVKEFVKVGKTSASIEIELYNEGPMAYKNNLYGNTITIVRNITSTGGSYKIKSARGQIISTHSKEVHNITSSLNIQVDNPVCLLTQDTSRNFLSSKDPKNKFSLFKKATQLETIESEFIKISANRDDCCKLLSKKQKDFLNLQEEIKKLKATVDAYQRIMSLKERKLLIQKELLWAEVKEAEDELARAQENRDTVIKEFEELQLKTQSRSQDVEIYEEDIKSNMLLYEKLQRELESEQERQLTNKGQLKQMQSMLTTKKLEKQSISIQIETKDKNVENLRKQIAENSENISNAEQQKQQRMRMLEDNQKKLKEFDSHLETAQNDLIQVKSDLTKKKDDETSLRTELDLIARKISEEESNLAALRKESGNVLILYGRNIPHTLALIDKYADRFTHKPKGPLGAYIKLRDKKWDVAVEGYLGQSILRAFTVDNQRDGKLLQEIFAKTIEKGQPKPMIITSKFVEQRHDVRKNLVRAPKDCISLYDVLSIDDPVVANCIIDQKSIESILLVPNNNRAIELMSNRRNVPAHCIQSITIKGDRYYPDPHYKTYASEYHTARFLQVNTEERAQAIQESIRRSMNNQTVMSNQLQALKREMNHMTQRQNELQEKIKKVNIVKNQIRTVYEDLSNQLEPETQDIANLEKILQEEQSSIAAMSAAMEKTDEEIAKFQRQIDEAKEALMQSKNFYKSLEERGNSFLEKNDHNRAKIRQIKNKREFDDKRLNELKLKVKEAEALISAKQEDASRKTKEAANVCERPAELRPVNHIFMEIQDMTRKITRIETESINIVEVVAAYRNLVNKSQEVSIVMHKLQATVKHLNGCMELRRKHYKLTENYFVTYMQHSFKENKKLDLVVMPQQGALSAGTTSNLSGGERSFSTVAFLYSLWQCMDFPFYFLDEFDVYMDKLNRTKVIDILLLYARSKPNLQFVFLTPQEVSFLPKDVTVLKLMDPERNA
ncbi:hypothetical protein GWI33_013720 [Rhynchophorus ferrugineus]|uniref:Rad50/SbcC-type AAA domain-containing protein n=1 Tax=Rhynchophorus ferrugineus TaxID=354439 RepID=A0A834I2U3_RHYFE|nr:hypothetical protein GWI33_013720 [Rhynchophorus ferrugineus]